MRLLSVRLQNWKNFKELQLSLQRRVFIAGPNASGKSNFLDIFRFLHDIASVNGGFQEAVSKREGVSKIRCLAARRYSDIVIDVTLGNDPDNPEWQYSLSFSQDNNRRPIVKREYVLHCPTNRVLLDRPDKYDENDPERQIQTHLEQVNTNKDFRQIADTLSGIRYLHIVPQLIRDPERYSGYSSDPFGSDFLEQIARTQQKTRDARLRRIRQALTIAVPQLKELVLDRDERGAPHLHGQYEHWRPNAGWQSEAQFSDGTLRLLGLLWAVLDGSGPLLLEEPELSLHPAVIRHIPAMLWRITRKSRRQVILSTHSVDLLSAKDIAPEEVILLTPKKNGTEARLASDDKEIEVLLKSGLTVADVVLPKVAPNNASQLELFDTF
jgi:predicted ATPase